MNSLISLFTYKTWANAELLEGVENVSADDHAGELHTAIRTLNHAYVTDRIFRAHLVGEEHLFTATNTVATPTLRALRSCTKENDAWFEEYAATITPGQLAEMICFTFTDGDAGRMSREEMLLHVIVHSGYHRGNVGQILKTVSVAPPRDLYTRFLHSSQPSRRQA